MDKKVLGILEYALAKEMEGMQYYESKANYVHNEKVKEVFKQLSLMEKDHVDYIQSLINKINEDEYISYKEDDIGDVFRNRQKNEIVYSGNLTALKTDLPVLRMAYLIEEDFMKFYEKSAEKIDNEEVKKILNHLAEWEKVHRDMVYELYQAASKDYWRHMDVDPLY